MPVVNNGVLDGVRRIGGRFRDIAVDGGLPGAPSGFRLRGATASGAPTSGTWKAGDHVEDRQGRTWICTAGGTGTQATWAGTVKVGGDVMAGYLAPAAVTLSQSGGLVAVNAALGNAFNLTISGSWTISNPTNAADGQVIRFRLTSGGSNTTSWDTNYDFGLGSAPALSTTAAKVDIVAFEYVSSITKWCNLGSGLGY